jgi:hypothetical protein
MSEVKDTEWFDAVALMLDALQRPYVLMVIDRRMVAGVEQPAGEVSTLWRSTLSREAAIEGLRQLADMLEQQPNLLEGRES